MKRNKKVLISLLIGVLCFIFLTPDRAFAKKTRKLLRADTKINSVVYKRNTYVELFSNGRVSYGIPRNRVRFKTARKDVGYLKAGSLMSFYSSGRLKSGTLHENFKYRGFYFQKGRYIKFYSNGRVQKGTLYRNTRIKINQYYKLVFRKYKEITFHSNGQVETGILYKSVAVGKKNINSGRKVIISKDGKTIKYKDRDGNFRKLYLVYLPRNSVNVSGEYKVAGPWGIMVFKQNGSEVTGYYKHQKGKISGTIRGNVLTCRWSEEPTYKPPRDAGDMHIIFNKDGSGFKGTWRYGFSGKWTHKIEGKRK
ncbi:MAG: hypothetical protein K8T10_07610 [Candidatus Eremiobacteraeota bacterium]|nr:hypothetical protein [Candidatus Eremiobacteraeota bacterium]